MLRNRNEGKSPTGRGKRGFGRLRLTLLAGALAVGGGVAALAQSGPPIPSQPVYPQSQQTYPQQSYPQQTYPGAPQPAAPQRELSAQELRCLQLEQELANDWANRANNDRGAQLKQIEEDIRKYDRIFQGTQAAMENGGCYESVFIFGRALVRSPKCLRMNDSVEDARRQLARLEQQKQVMTNPGSARRRQDELIDALARAGCGRQYQQQARRRDSGSGGFFSNFFGGPDYDYPRRDNLETSRIEAFATYRTLCVRTCDGFYFPISYSALPSQFNNDISACQAQCAAPAELFVYRNPGEEPEQMISADGSTAYASTPNAFRFRKEYVKGCSCKVTEYNPAEIDAYNQKAAAEGKIKGATPPQVAQEKAPSPLARPNQQ